MTDYSAIAGFDTATLAAGGFLTAAALSNGSAGVAIANAANTALAGDAGTIAGNGIALIEAVASDTGASPVRSLMTFIHRAVILTGNLNIIQGVTNAFYDLLHAPGTTLTGAAVASDAAAATISIAASGNISNAVAAGEELEIALAQVRIGGGEGGSASPYASAVAQIQAAIGGALTNDQAIGILAGFGAESHAEAALQTLIGSDAAKATTAIAALAAAAGRHDAIIAAMGFGAYDTSFNQSAASYIGQIAGWANLTASQVNAIVASAIGPSLTPAQAVALLGQLSGGTDQILTLIANHTITATDAMAAVAGGYFSSNSALNGLIAIAAAPSADFTLQMAVASGLASLVSNGRLEANEVISALAGQLTPALAMSMLMATGGLGNVLSSNNKYSLNQIGDAALASPLSGTDLVTAMVAGFGALGLTVDQQVTILVGVGGASKQQTPSLSYSGRADLQAAGAQQLYALIQANSAHLTADQLATDIAAAMNSAYSVYWPTNIDILVRAAAGDATMPAMVGAALAKLSGLSPLSGQNGLAYVLSAVDADSVSNNRVLTADQTIGILIGMAAAGNNAVQVAAGGELGSLVDRNMFLAGVNPGANIAAALSAGTLTQGQATLLLAGLAASAKSALIKDAYQNQYVSVLTTLLSANAAGVIATISNAVASTALSADAAVAFLAGIAGNATGPVPAAAENAILALVSNSAISATQAITDLAAAAGTAGAFIAIRVGGGTPGTPLYDDGMAYLATYEGALGDTVALLVTQGQINAQDAVTAIDAAVTAGKLKGTDALRMLVSAAAGNANIEPLAQAEIATLIANSATNGLTTAAAVAALQAMLTGAGTALANVINGELGILLADPSGLDQTAGTGTSVQIMQQAILLGGLLNNGVQADIDNANTVLSHFAGRITTAHTLTAAGALEFLLDLAGQGGAALSAATATLVALAHPSLVQFGPININTAITQTGAALAAGTINSDAAILLLGSLSATNNGNGGIQFTLASAIGSGPNQITIAQIDAAVTAGTLVLSDVMPALGTYARNHGGADQAAAIAEINHLATDTTSRDQALQALVGIGQSTDATIRAGGYAGLNAFIAANMGYLNNALSAVIDLIDVNTDAGVKNSAQAELVELLTNYSASPITVVNLIAPKITAAIAFQGGSIVGQNGWLKIMVGLLAAPNTEQNILGALLTRAQNDFAAYPQYPSYTADTIIADIAELFGSDVSRRATTAAELARFTELLVQLEPNNSGVGDIALTGVADMASGLMQRPVSEQIALLQAIVDYYTPLGSNASAAQLAIINDITARISTLMGGQPLADTAAYIATLIQSGAPNAMQLAVGTYNSSAPGDFITLVNAIASHLTTPQISSITNGIAALAGTPSIGQAGAVQMLLAIGVLAVPDLQKAAATTFASALVANTFDPASLFAGLSGGIPSVASRGQVVTFLSDVYLAQLSTSGPSTGTASVKSQVIAEILTLTQGLGGPNPGSLAAAAAVNFVNIDEALALGEFIEAALEQASLNPTEASIAQSIADTAALIGGVQATRIIVSLAGHRGGNFLAPAGAAIANLVGSGALTAGNAGFYIYAGFAVDHVMTQAQSIQVAIGAGAGGSPAAAGEAFANLLSHSLATNADIANALASAVSAHSITAPQAVDITAAMATGSLGVVPSASLLDAMLATGLISGQGATVQLAVHIGQPGFSVGTFMALVADAAAGTTAAGRASIGVGLAELLAAGTITTQQIAAGLDLAVNGDGHGSTPTLSIDAAMAVLTGAAADASTAAVQAPTVTQIGGLIAGLIGNNASYGQSAVTAIVNAATSLEAVNPIDTHAAMRSLLVSAANAGSTTALTAVGKALAVLEHTGKLSVQDLFSLNGMADDKEVFVLASALILDSAPEDSEIRRWTASIIGTLISSNAIMASAAYAQIGAANTAQSGSSSDLLAALVAVGSNSVSLGQELFRLVSNGTMTWNAVVAASPGDNSVVGFAAAANAAQAASPSTATAAIQNDVYTNMLSRTPTDWALFIGNGIGVGGATLSDNLGVLAQLAIRGNFAVTQSVGAELISLYNQNRLTFADIQTSLNSAGATAGQSGVIYATMLPGARNDVSEIQAVLGAIAALVTPSNTAGIVAAIHAAIAPVNSTDGLSVGDAVTALTALAVTNATPAMLTAIAAEIASLVTAGRLSAADADYYIGNSATNAPANGQYPRAALLAYLGSALGQDAGSFVNTIGLATVSRAPGSLLQLSQAQAIALEAMLVDNAAVDPYGINTLYPTLVSSIAAALPPPSWTVQFAAMSQLSDAAKMAFLVQVAESGQGPRAAIEAGKAAGATIADFTLALSGQPVAMTRDQTALFLAGYMLSSPVNAPAIAMILVNGYNLGGVSMTFPATTLIAALDAAANGYRVSDNQPFLYGVSLSGAELALILERMLPLAITRASALFDQTYYTAILAEYRTMLQQGYITAPNLASTLLAQAGAADDQTRSAAGQILASLYQTGQYSQADLVNAINAALGAHSLTPAQAVQVMTAMANMVGDNALSPALGDVVGNMIAGGQVSVAGVIAGVEAINHTPFLFPSTYGEFAVLVRAAQYLTPAQDRELGAGLGRFAGYLNGALDAMALIDQRTNAGVLSVDQATSLLLGMIGAPAFNANQSTKMFQVALAAGELAKLVSGGLLTAGAAITLLDSAVTDHSLTYESVLPALVFFGADNSGGQLQAVENEIALLVSSGRITPSQVLDGVFATADRTAFGSYQPLSTISVIAGILDTLRAQGVYTTQGIIDSINNGAVSADNGLTLLVRLAGSSDAASLTLIGQEIASLILQGSITAVTAGTRIKTNVPGDAALSLFMTIAHAGYVANNMAAVAPALASADVLPVAQIISTLQSAVTAGTLTVHEQVAVLTGLTLSSQLWGVSVGTELKRLITSGATSASQLFADLEVSANSISSGYYFQQLGYAIAAIGDTSDVALQVATGNEIGRLILQGKFTADGSSSSTGYPVPGGDLTARYTVWLAIAQSAGAAVQRDVGSNIGVSLNTNGYTAADIYPVLEHALQVGAIDGSHLAGVLAAISTQDSNTRLAIPSSASEFAALVQNGVISLADAMAGVDAVASAVSAASIATWLTIASQSSSTLTGGVGGQIQAFITEGRLTDTTALNAVTAVGSRASAATVAKVLVGLSSVGDIALQIGAGAKLAGLIAANFTDTQILANVDSAVTAHTMPGVNAINVMLGFLSAMPNGGAGSAAANYINGHIRDYVTAGLLTGAAATSALLSAVVSGPVQIAPFAGGVLVGVSSINAAIGSIRSAVTAGTLNVHQAVQMLTGVASAGGTPAAIAEIQAMVSAHQVTMTQVIQDFQAAGVAGNMPVSMYVALAATADAAGRAAIASVVADRGRHFGPYSDPFFNGASQQAALDFIDIVNGVKTVDQAIADIKQYAPAHHASTDAGLSLLEFLLSHNDLYSTSVTVHDAIADRLMLGAFSAELAQRVAEGETPDNQRLGSPVPADTSAISYAAARSLLDSVIQSYGTGSVFADGSTISPIADFALDVSILKINRGNRLFNGDFVPSDLRGHLVRYAVYQLAQYQGLNPAEKQSANLYMVTGYAVDQALLALIGQLSVSNAANAAGNLAEARELLGARVLKGPAATDLVNQVANGTLTQDQALAALNAMLAPVVAGVSAESATLARQTALAWLAIKSAQYIEGNYELVTDANGVRSIVTHSDNVNFLLGALRFGQSDDVLAGLGAILRNGSTSITADDRATDLKLVQSILGDVADASVAASSGGRMLTTNADIKAASDQAMADTADKFRSFTNGFLSINAYFGLPGLADVVTDPRAVKGYVDLGTQMAAGGLPFTFGYNTGLPDLTGATYDQLLGEGVGGNLAVVGTAAKVILFVLGFNAVSNALGPIAPTIRGMANVTAATTDLLGNIVTGVATATKDAYWDAGRNIGITLSDLGQGNFGDLQGDAESTAIALFTISSGGFTPQSMGAIEGTGRSIGAALVDLSSGNPDAAGRDAIALGLNVIKVIQSNVYLNAAATAIKNYANQIVDDLRGALIFTAEFIDHIQNGTLFTRPVPPQTLIRDLSAVGTNAYKDPRSFSTYGDFYHASVIDGYISGATVFVDTDGDGVLDPGEYTTTTDAHGGYDLPAGIMGSIVTIGGTDTSTGLAFHYQLSAPNGSTAVTALTTLVQKIAAANGSDLIAANRQVAAAFGLDPSMALTQTDPVAAVRAGATGGASLVLATTAVLNTLILLESAGATGDPTAVLAARIANAPFGTPIDLTNAATIADLANASGVSASAGAAVAQLASASNTLLTNLINTAPDPTTLLNRATAVTVVAQGNTATALVNAGNDPTLLASAVNQYTGTNLTNTVQTKLGEVITQPAEPYYGPPRWYLDPAITGVVSTGSASGNSLSGSQSNQQMLTALHDAASSPSSASSASTPDLLTASSTALVPSLENLFRAA